MLLHCISGIFPPSHRQTPAFKCFRDAACFKRIPLSLFPRFLPLSIYNKCVQQTSGIPHKHTYFYWATTGYWRFHRQRLLICCQTIWIQRKTLQASHYRETFIPAKLQRNSESLTLFHEKPIVVLKNIVDNELLIKTIKCTKRKAQTKVSLWNTDNYAPFVPQTF